MAESIVKVPKNNTADYDFIAFSFKDLHSYEDFGIIRTSDGSRYNENLAPELQDKSVDFPNGDGMLYFGTYHKQKVFNINFAFEEMDDSTLARLKEWLNGKEMGDLWFAEAPYKVWSVKVTGTPTIKYVPFEKNGKRIYNGEGSVTFTAYWPYAHTPDKVQKWDNNNWVDAGDGKKFSSYSEFNNENKWQSASRLTNGNSDGKVGVGENYGDIPAPFVVSYDSSKTISDTSSGTKFQVGDLSITIAKTSFGGDVYNPIWDSKTGMVSGTTSSDPTSTRKAIPYTGNSLGAIPIDGILSDDISINGATLKYHYWYY